MIVFFYLLFIGVNSRSVSVRYVRLRLKNNYYDWVNNLIENQSYIIDYVRKFDALVSKKLGQDQTLLINTLIAYISM